jgi:tetratricopeptide (TPR) repeat protein
VTARRVACLVLAVLAWSPAVLAAGPTREEALAALGDKADAESRRRGAQALGEIGVMADVPRLAAALRDTDPVVRAFAESAMWQVWSRSGDATVDRLFSEGVAQMNASQGDQAVDTFSEIIRRRPEFAEGWNKRATVHYLLGNWTASVLDIERTLALEPRHFGALFGLGLIYDALEQPEAALRSYEATLQLNPNSESARTRIEELRRQLQGRPT